MVRGLVSGRKEAQEDAKNGRPGDGFLGGGAEPRRPSEMANLFARSAPLCGKKSPGPNVQLSHAGAARQLADLPDD